MGNGALSGVAISDYNTITQAISQAHTCMNIAYVMLQNIEQMARHLQLQLGIKSRWEIGGPEYVHFKNEDILDKYHKVLNELEWLVVMHLFELSKLLMSNTSNVICHFSSYFSCLVCRI